MLGGVRVLARGEGSPWSELGAETDPVPTDVPRRTLSTKVMLEAFGGWKGRRSDVDVPAIEESLRSVRTKLDDVYAEDLAHAQNVLQRSRSRVTMMLSRIGMPRIPDAGWSRLTRSRSSSEASVRPLG